MQLKPNGHNLGGMELSPLRNARLKLLYGPNCAGPGGMGEFPWGVAKTLR
jgi:hypothetical protein